MCATTDERLMAAAMALLEVLGERDDAALLPAQIEAYDRLADLVGCPRWVPTSRD